MVINDQNRQLWTSLYEAAIELRELQPWKWMTDADLFGVQDPETGETGYCCILGNAGQVYALGVYPGPEGLASYQRMIDEGDEGQSNAITAALLQKLFMVSYEDREALSDRDLNQIKALDLKNVRGKGKWVLFREYEPGYLPWYIDEDQARFLLRVIPQVIDVAKRFRENRELLRSESEEEEFLVRTPTLDGADIHWEDQYHPVPDLPETPSIEPDQGRIEAIREYLEPSKQVALCGITLLPGGMREDPNNEMERPFFAHLALMLDFESQMIVGQQIFHPAELRNHLQEWFLESLSKIGSLPQTLITPNEFTYGLLEDITDALDTEIAYAPNAPAFEEVIDFLFQQMGINE